MADKAYDEMAKMLKPFAAKVFTVTPDNPRALPSESLALLYRDFGVEAEAFDSVSQAVAKACEEAKENGYDVMALGSLYMYGEVKQALALWQNKA